MASKQSLYQSPADAAATSEAAFGPPENRTEIRSEGEGWKDEFESASMAHPVGDIRLLLVDHYPVVRAGLRLSLEAIGGMTVVAEAKDGTEAIEIGILMQPDVALIDVTLQALDGIDAALALKVGSPKTRIALVSGDFNYRALARGVASGAHGFILKSDHPDRFAAMIREIHRGTYCCSEALADRLVPTSEGFQVIHPIAARLDLLTAREREMLARLADGKSLKQAARSLGVSYKSADHLKQSLMHKLDIHDRVELVRLVIQEGLTS